VLKNLELTNWRSVQNQTIKLESVNVSIGPNAAGNMSDSGCHP